MGNAHSSLRKLIVEPVDIGGLTPFTSIDYPGQLSAVLFLQGCPWRCIYCHNESLLCRDCDSPYRWDAVCDFLQRRIGLIDAVVFSGGEPTLQSGLEQAIRRIRNLGFKIGLHSAGIYPERLKKILPLLDWIGLDIKSTVEQYDQITGVPGSGERAWLSAQLVSESGVDYEIRTTLHPLLMESDHLRRLIEQLKQLGVSNYSMQRCNLDFCSSDYGGKYLSVESWREQLAFAEGSFTQFTYRD